MLAGVCTLAVGPLETWRKVHPAGIFEADHLAFANGKLLAAAMYSTPANSQQFVIYESDNGEVWNETLQVHTWVQAMSVVGNDVFIGLQDGSASWLRASGEREDLGKIGSTAIMDMAFQNGIYVAACYQRDIGMSFLRSLEGKTWTPRPAGGAAIGSITAGNNLFVGVGTAGSISTSPDGIMWTAQVSGSTNTLLSVTFGAGLFVAVGVNNTILTSTDGVSWTSRTESFTRTYWKVWYGNGRFLAAAQNKIFSSIDGINWTEAIISRAFELGAFAFGNGVFIASGTGVGVCRSTDGINWEVPPRPLALGPVEDIAVHNGVYVVSNSGYIRYSDDLAKWSQRSTFQAKRVSFIESLFLAFGSLPYYSNDGMSWTNSSGAEGSFQSITYGNGIFVGVVYPGRIQTSVDGRSWATPVALTNKNLLNIAFGGGTFVATGTNLLFTSTNGTNWSSRASFTYTVRWLQFHKGLFVGTGENGLILTSADGETWMPRESHTADRIGKVAYGHGHFLTVTSGGAVLTSTDAVEWVGPRVITDQELYSVTATDDGFLVVGGYGNVLKSGHMGPPKLLPTITRSGGGTALSVKGEVPKRYWLESKDALENAEWVGVKEFSQETEIVEVIDSTPSVGTSFYRVVLR
jgi:hypothetical protein